MRRAPEAFPTAVPTHITSPGARSVLNGRYAEASFNGTLVALLFDWRIRVNWDYANLTAAGDRWKVNVFLDADWTATARGYILVGASTTYVQTGLTTSLPAIFKFTGYSGSIGSTGQKIWEGDCFIRGAEFSAPMALFEQQFEVIGTGVPNVGIS